MKVKSRWARLLSGRQSVGGRAEQIARWWLDANGVRIVAANVRMRQGEIDLVGLEGDTLVFFEVRLRRRADYGGAAGSIGRQKQRRIILAARAWLQQAGARHARRPCRFDAVLLDSLESGGVQWLRGAFEDWLPR